MPDIDDDVELPPLHSTPDFLDMWYTDQRPSRASVVDSPANTVFVDALGEDVRYTNHLSNRIRGRVAQRTGIGSQALSPYLTFVDPADLAGEFGLVSANAATHAVLTYGEEYLRQRQDDLDNCLESDRPYYRDYVATTERILDLHRQHSQCACQDCYIPANVPECRCQRHDCDECYPDGFDWEDEGWDEPCTCSVCWRPSLDDLDDDDDPDFAGLPEVVAPPGRVRFGIEIEFDKEPGAYQDDLRNDIMRRMSRSGLSVANLGYTHEVTRCWKMTTDATVTGGELVSPIMSGSDESIEEVREALRLIKEAGGVTSRNVGMHVHLDVSRFRTSQLKALATNMQRAERMLAAYVPEHRYNGSIGCGANLLSDYEWGSIYDWIEHIDPAEHCRSRENRVSSCPIDRYRSINFNSLLNYGTVEIRLLGHTLNTIKVRTWIRALQTIVDASGRRALISGDGLEWLVQHGLEPEHANRFRDVALRRGNEAWLAAAA